MRLASLMLALPLMACGGNASGIDDRSPRIAKTFAVNGFDRVANAAPASVEISTGRDFSVRAEGNQKLIDRLEARVENGVLRIDTKKDSSWNWGGNQGSAKVTITMPDLHGATIAGAGDMTIDRGSGDFKGDITGTGDMTIGEIRGGDITLSISGSGSMGVAGTADRVRLNVAGAGSIRAKELRARSAKVSVAGAGSVAATIDGDAQVSIAGVGSVDLGDRARCTVSKAGVGSVKCGG